MPVSGVQHSVCAVTAGRRIPTGTGDDHAWTFRYATRRFGSASEWHMWFFTGLLCLPFAFGALIVSAVAAIAESALERLKAVRVGTRSENRRFAPISAVSEAKPDGFATRTAA